MSFAIAGAAVGATLGAGTVVGIAGGAALGALGGSVLGGSMGGGTEIPGPDPQIGQASADQIRLNREMFDYYRNVEQPWARDVAEQALGIQSANAESARELSDYQLGMMQRNDQRYQNVAVPFEDQLLADVKRFDSQAYKDQQVAQALADVNAAFSSSNQQQIRGLSRMGVNPNSGRMAAMSNQNSIAQATAMANAANKTRQAADQIGLSTKMQMYGGMKGLAGLGATNAGLATGAMGTGNQSAAGMSNSVSSYLNGNNSAQGAFNSGTSAGINGLYGSSSLAMNAANLQAQNDPTAMFLGAATQLGSAAIGKYSDRRLKTDIVAVGKDERSGLTLYEFAYKQEPSKRFIGVMADEVQVKYPHAVITMPDGYLAVDYKALGIEMVTIEEGGK